MQLLALFALHGTLGYAVAWAFDLGTFLKFGLPLIFIAGNVLLAPVLMDKAFRIDWEPEDPPLSEDLCRFLLELFQMHGKAPPEELARMLGAHRQLLPISLGLVDEEAPHIFLAKGPKGAGLVVSKGFRDLLDPEAQKAALAHEVYYLLRAERTFLGNALMTLPTILFALYRVVEPKPGGRWWERYAAQLLYAAYRLSTAASAWPLRQRVLEADAFAVEMTGDPNAMARAILFLSFGLAKAASEDEGGPTARAAGAPHDLADLARARELAAEAAALGDFSPRGMARALRWERANLAARYFEAFSSHPLPSRRLDALAEAASGRGREFEFEHGEPEGGVRFAGLLAELVGKVAPWVCAYLGYLYCLEYDWPSNAPFFVVAGFGSGIAVASLLWYMPFLAYAPRTTRDLLTDLDASDAYPVPASLEGRIVGRHKPGYAFGADLVFRDEKGTLMLQYRQPVPLLDTAFAYFTAAELKGRPVRVEGWFRRNPEPFLEIRRMTMLDDGRVFGCYKFLWQWLLVGLFAGLAYWIRANF